jgi:hypothetical protein
MSPLNSRNALRDSTIGIQAVVCRVTDVVQGKRVFVKDMGKCLLPLPGQPTQIVPSLRLGKTASHGGLNGGGPMGHGGHDAAWTTPNPTVMPNEALAKFHYAFLIRNPRRSIPSLYQCSTPPKCYMTGWHGFKPEDAGYHEMRRLFDHLRRIGQIGPNTNNRICIVDAEDLLAYPENIVEQFCESVGIPFDRDMLQWDSEEDQRRAHDAFKNWAPFHDAVLRSKSLVAQPPVSFLYFASSAVV